MSKESHPHRAKKSLGQNFLQDDNICRKIVAQLDIQPEDLVVEIGPGKGALTRFILEDGPGRFMAIEKDRVLAAELATRHPGIEVVEGDALAYEWSKLRDLPNNKIVGNLPYNVGSKLIWDIVSQATSMRIAVFMVQHEVALRLTAEHGCKAYGGLTAWVQNHCDTRYLFKVPPSVFRPQPKVDSAVVSFTPLPEENRPDDPDGLSRLIKRLFQQRRKQVSTILKTEWSEDIERWFEKEGVLTSVRPEMLTPQQIRELSCFFK